jgi:hypothetical protein
MQKEKREKETEPVINNIPRHVRARISDSFERSPKAGVSYPILNVKVKYN